MDERGAGWVLFAGIRVGIPQKLGHLLGLRPMVTAGLAGLSWADHSPATRDD